MTRLLWLADELRAYGLTVVEVTGWQDRARPGAFDPLGVMVHHTAAPQGKPFPSLQVCIDGRTGLAGPLCNVLLARNCTCYVISAGRCNHAGQGRWAGIEDGNRAFLGLEAENDGVGEPWAPDMLDAFHRATAALCAGLGGSGPVIAHREWAPARKTDPKGIDMAHFRARVAAVKPTGDTMPTNPPSATEAALIEQWQQMLLDNGAPIGNKDGRFGRLTLEHSRKVLDHRNQLLAQVAKLEAERDDYKAGAAAEADLNNQLTAANATSADTIVRLTAERDRLANELARHQQGDVHVALAGIVEELSSAADDIHTLAAKLQGLA